MHEILIDILEAVIILATMLITRYLVPYIKSLIHESKYAELIEVIAAAVRAAEDTIVGSKKGKIKEADVVAFVSHWLAKKNLHITEDELIRLIRAAVHDMNNSEV